MTGKDLNENVIKQNPNLRMATKVGIITGVLLITALVTYILGTNGVLDTVTNDQGIAFGILAITGVTGAIGLFFTLSCLVVGLIGAARVNSYVSSHDKDEIIAEIKEADYVFSDGKKPITVFARSFIFDVGLQIIDPTKIDMAYGYRTTKIKLFMINGRVTEMCYGILMGGDDIKICMAHLARYNPNVLLGYTAKNEIEHKKRVKAFKAGK